MAEPLNKNRGSGFLNLGGRNIRLTNNHEGVLQHPKKVIVAENGKQAGTIFAPKVEIAGIVVGNVISKEVHLKSNGEVWGDIYTTSLRLDAHSTIQGWVGSIAEAQYAELVASLAEMPATAPPSENNKITLGMKIAQDERLQAMRSLQQQLAESMAKNFALENQLNGSTPNLNEIEVEKLLADKETLHNQVTVLEAMLLSREQYLSQLEQTGEDIAAAEPVAIAKNETATEIPESITEADLIWNELSEAEMSLLSSMADEQKDAQAQSKNHSQTLIRLQTERDNLFSRLAILIEERDALRFETANLRSLSQKLPKLEAEVAQWALSAEASEDNLKEAQATLETFRKENNIKLTNLENQVVSQQSQFDKQLAQMENTANEQKDSYDSLLVEAKNRVSELRSRLNWLTADRESKLQKIKKLQKDDSAASTRLADREAVLKEAKVQLREHRANDQVWRENAGRLTRLLYQAEQRSVSLEKEKEKIESHFANQIEIQESAHGAETKKLKRQLIDIAAALKESNRKVNLLSQWINKKRKAKGTS